MHYANFDTYILNLLRLRPDGTERGELEWTQPGIRSIRGHEEIWDKK